MILVFDGSFDGFLTAVFDSYKHRYDVQKIVAKHDFVPDFLMEYHCINTDLDKSARVWSKLKQLFEKDNYLILWAFLSEKADIYTHLYHIIRQKIANPHVNILANHTNEAVSAFHQAVKVVGRERHRMQAFVRFEDTVADVYFAKIYPDFNVLPLVVNFFAKRFADQNWLIFDEKRHFGVYYNKDNKKLVDVVDVDKWMLIQSKQLHSANEMAYQKLWQTYFKHVTIAERKNLKHHVQQMPKRYWRYLTEKQGL